MSAFSSTRRVSRNSTSSSVAPFSARFAARASSLPWSNTSSGIRDRLDAERLHVVEPQAEIDHLELLLVGVAPVAALERGGAGEPGLVEVPQDEERDAVLGAQALRQLAGGGDRDALRRHEGEVVTLRDLDRLEERVEAFLLDEQQAAETRGGTGGLDARSRTPSRSSALAGAAEIVAHVGGAEPDLAPGVRLAKVAPVVIVDVVAPSRLVLRGCSREAASA